MDWNPSTLWWLTAGVLVAAELATGTFYLLMLALGCAAAALGAHAGLGATAQVVAAAVVGGGATALWHVKRSRSPEPPPAERNPDVNIDIGQTVHVTQWSSDGTARVQYRGAGWTARLADAGPHQGGEHRIVAVHGNELRLAPGSSN